LETGIVVTSLPAVIIVVSKTGEEVMQKRSKNTCTRDDLVKLRFSDTLKKMAEKKPLSGISVSALVKASGMSRSTFYYHFIDLFDLINWTAENEIFRPLGEFIRDREFGWHGITGYCLSVMYKNQNFYTQAVAMSGQNCLRDYLYRRNQDMWELLIHKYLEHMGIEVDPERLSFMVEYTSQSIAGMTVTWALEGMKTPVDQLAVMDDLATMGIYGTLKKNSETPAGEE
jgi:AcrR family transcriptional regulator